MQGVFGLSVRLVAGALALVALLWLFHPGYDAACRAATPGFCWSSIWDGGGAAVAKPTETEKPPGASVHSAIASARALREAGKLPEALAALDIAGQWALRHYEAEERQNATRRVRYLFVDLDLEARRLAAAAEKAKRDDLAGPAIRYGETFSALASVEGIELVLRRANLRAPKALDGAILSGGLASAIREFWQDLAPTEVFFVTDRERDTEDTGYFGDAVAATNGLTWGAATVSAPVYVNEAGGADQMQSVEDAPERGARQAVSVRTVKNLEQAQFDARAAGALSQARHKEAMIYLHGAEVSFEHALIRAAEMKLALRIDGPVAVISWGRDASATTSCASAATAKLTLVAWKRMAKIASGARLHVVAHGQGACATFAPYDHGGGAAEQELQADHLVFLQPDYGHADIAGPFHRAPGGVDNILIYYNQPATELAAAAVDQVCPWDPSAEKRAAFSRAEKPMTVHKIEIGVRPSVANGLDGADYLLNAMLDDLRAKLWTAADQPGQRCGMCKITAAQPVFWRLFADRCGEPQTLALDLRRVWGKGAEGQIDTALKDLSPAERDMVRDRLKALPARQ